MFCLNTTKMEFDFPPNNSTSKNISQLQILTQNLSEEILKLAHFLSISHEIPNKQFV